MRAGDGVKANASCYPNVTLYDTLTAHDQVVYDDGVTRRTARMVVGLLQPTRYALHYTCNTSLCRSIQAHEEITLFYNNPRNGLVRVHEKIGGCFRPFDCNCGSHFCCGEILRRLMHDELTESDCYFFQKDKKDKLCLNIHVLQSANAAAPWCPLSSAMRLEYAQMARRSTDGSTYTPLTVDTIVKGFLQPANDEEDVQPLYEQDILN